MLKFKLWLNIAVVVTILGLIAGCGSSTSKSSNAPQNASESTASSAPASTPESTAKDAGKEAPEPLNVEVFDRNNLKNGETAINNPWTKWIHDQVLQKLNIDVTFVPVPRSQEVSKLNVLMATNDAPDIVFTYDQNTVSDYAKSGGLLDVSELLDQYGPDLKTYLGDDLLAYGKIFGKQVAIPAKRGFVGNMSSLIRKDWLDKLNMPVPTTTEQFLKTMEAFKEKDPGNTGGKTVPYGIVSFDAKYNINSGTLLKSFIKRGSEEEFYEKYDFMMPGFEDGLRFLNQMYNEGLISKDFPIDKDGKQFERDFTNGYVGAVTETGTAVIDTFMVDTLKKNVPGANFVVMDAFTDNNGKHPKEIYSAIDKYIFIPKASKHAEAAVKYLNWMADKDNLFTLVNGIENQDYKMVNDIPVGIVDPNKPNNRFDLSIITNGLDYGSDEKNIQAYVGNKVPNYPELGTDLLKSSLVDGYTPPYFDRPIEAQIKYGSILKDKQNEIETKAVTAKPSDFDAVYDSGMKEYMSLGGQALIDDRMKAYQDMKAGN